MSGKLRRSNGIVTETAHLNTDDKKFCEGYDRIFGKKTNEMDLIIGMHYVNLKNNKIYTIIGFIEDCDDDKEKILYAELAYTKFTQQYTRSLPRFRQKFKLLKEE